MSHPPSLAQLHLARGTLDQLEQLLQLIPDESGAWRFPCAAIRTA
jgi:hypothetical protein